MGRRGDLRGGPAEESEEERESGNGNMQEGERGGQRWKNKRELLYRDVF